MSAVEAGYYHSLARFESFFQGGRPILTYHKLGPRPAHTRLKGLYVSEKLFSQQLAELKNAGFSTISLGTVSSDFASPNRNFVITFDDGFRNVLEFGLQPLAAHGFTATQFLVADLIGKRNEWDVGTGEAPAVLMNLIEVGEWLAGGHSIGSHTLTHPYLTRISLERAKEEIVASKKKLEDVFGVPVEHFCYPYGQWNEAIRDLVAEAGYLTACSTDFGINTPKTDPYALKRITARYRSRNWKAFKQWVADLFVRK